MEQYLTLPMVWFLGNMEDEENWLYFFRHFQNAGLANSITFFMSDRDKGLINAVRKVFPDMDCNFAHYVIPKDILDILV